MAQLTKELVEDILNGGGLTENEVAQLCTHYLKSLSCIDALRDVVDTGFMGGPQGFRARKALAAFDGVA